LNCLINFFLKAGLVDADGKQRTLGTGGWGVHFYVSSIGTKY